jgi:hypothetical protein
VADTYKRLNRFNNAQGFDSQLHIPCNESGILALLAAAHDQRFQDAQALVAADVLPAPADSLARSQYLVIVLPSADKPHGFDPGFGSLYALSVEGDMDNSTHMRVIDSVGDLRGGSKDLDFFAHYFHLEPLREAHWSATVGDLSYGLAGLLAHERVRLPTEFYI